MPLLDALKDHFDPETARVVDTVLRAAASYAEGDALAGARLTNLSAEEYGRLTEIFRGAGFDVEFRTRMDLVSFVTDPGTGDERLDAEVRDL